MGTSPQAVYNWEKGKNQPASKNLLTLAGVLRVDGQRFLAGEVMLLGEEIEAAPQAAQPLKVQRSHEVELAPDVPDFGTIGGSRDVPEYGIAVGGEEGDFTLNGEVVGYVTRPLSLKGRTVFAVRVKGSSMSPRFDEGDVLYVERHREPGLGDDGIFEMKPTDEWEAGHAFVKQLVAKGMGIVKVKQFNPAKDLSYRRDEIARMFRIVPRNELLSV